MHSANDLRRRIRSISGTAMITKAMQMVAASKMRKAQEAALALRPFVRLLYRFQREASTRMGSYTNPLLEVREVRKRAVILVSSDRGLCGALNTNLFRLAGQFAPETTVFVAAGRQAEQFVARTGRQLAAKFTYQDTPRYSDATAIASFACNLFLKKEVDQVQVIVTSFVNTLTQVPLCLEYLPVGEIKGLHIAGAKLEKELAELEKELAADKSECLFEPGPADVLGLFFSRYVNLYIYSVLIDARASEQSARMVSMKNATDSAEHLIHDLTLEYNKLRQDNITKELLDLAGGKAA
jgi:F-type H+-transporting ATPase subunit gamma